MKVAINLINVEDGDALLVMLNDKHRKSLIVIDGGYKKYYPKVKKRLAQVLPLYNNKIDLLICTHYDNDHIGGVEKMLDDYHQIIEQIWIHKIDNNIEDTINVMNAKVHELHNAILVAIANENSTYDPSLQLALEGYKDLLRVVQKIKDYGLTDKIVEAKQGDYFATFPEFSVISPSAAYYNSNLTALKEDSILEDLKNKHQIENAPTTTLLYEAHINSELPTNDCAQLATSSIANGVSATNMVSIVTLLEFDNKRFLFTGDSGIESYEPNTHNWKTKLKDLFFLVVPHHGSKNNTSEEMLRIFNPKHVFVSAKNTHNRPSTLIANCLKSKKRLSTFEVSNKDLNTWYISIDENGRFERIFDQ